MPDDKLLSARPDVNTLVSAGKTGSAAGAPGSQPSAGGHEEGGRDDEGA